MVLEVALDSLYQVKHGFVISDNPLKDLQHESVRLDMEDDCLASVLTRITLIYSVNTKQYDHFKYNKANRAFFTEFPVTIRLAFIVADLFYYGFYLRFRLSYFCSKTS